MNEISMVDTHSHLYLPDFDIDIQEVIDRSIKAGIKKIFMPSIDLENIPPMIATEEKYPEICRAMMGLHPCYVNETYENTLDKMEQWLGMRAFAAIGEVGLDYHWETSNIETQKRAFERQVEWAVELRLPVIIHSRKSMEDCIAIIKKYQKGQLRGIFHCFSGSVEEAKRIQGLGFLMGIGGVLTYKNAGLKEVVKSIPTEYLVLETDAPYLTPVPFRGKRNEPSYLTYILEALAEAKELSPLELAKETTENALKLFGQKS